MMITSHGAAAILAKMTHAKVAEQDDSLTSKGLGRLFLFGILPDIPLALLVISGRFDPDIHYHHRWITHTPVFWLIISLLTMRFYSRDTGLELLAATWLHLGMDWYGGADGIAFLYPLTDRQYGAGLSGVNGPEGLQIYFSKPLFSILEIAIQGSALLAVIFKLFPKLIRKK